MCRTAWLSHFNSIGKKDKNLQILHKWSIWAHKQYFSFIIDCFFGFQATNDNLRKTQNPIMDFLVIKQVTQL